MTKLIEDHIAKADDMGKDDDITLSFLYQALRGHKLCIARKTLKSQRNAGKEIERLIATRTAKKCNNCPSQFTTASKPITFILSALLTKAGLKLPAF